MPWQRYVADVALEIDPATGWWAFDKIVLTVQRRAGKSALDQAVKLDRMATGRNLRLWMSAQGGEEAKLLWREMDSMIQRSPLATKIRTYTTTGHERMVWLPTRSELTPIPPDGDKLHGKAIDSLHLDELWWYGVMHAQKMKAGYRPTFLTTNAQAWLISTMGTEESVWLNQERDEGRRAVELGANRGTAYFEWSVPPFIGGVPVNELSDEDLVDVILRYHPANGTHPLMPAAKLADFVREDLADELIGRKGVLRAYGNLVQPSTGGWSVISQPQWVAAMSSRPIPPQGEIGLGFEVDPDGRDAAIAVAWRAPDGSAIVEVIKVKDGATWVAGDVRALHTRWGVLQVAMQNSGPGRHVADGLIAGGMEVLRMSQMDFSAACALFHAGVTARPVPIVRHIGQAVLNSAVEHVTKRRTGPSGAWAWRIDPAVSITALVAATAALWAADHPREVEEELGPFRVY